MYSIQKELYCLFFVCVFAENYHGLHNGVWSIVLWLCGWYICCYVSQCRCYKGSFYWEKGKHTTILEGKVFIFVDVISFVASVAYLLYVLRSHYVQFSALESEYYRASISQYCELLCFQMDKNERNRPRHTVWVFAIISTRRYIYHYLLWPYCKGTFINRFFYQVRIPWFNVVTKVNIPVYTYYYYYYCLILGIWTWYQAEAAKELSGTTFIPTRENIIWKAWCKIIFTFSSS